MAVLALLCGPQGTHENNEGILGGVMALMGTPGVTGGGAPPKEGNELRIIRKV